MAFSETWQFWPDGSSARLLMAVSLLALISGIWITLQRLVFSPVARVPGPRLAALTFWYEYYYDVWKKGQYTFHLKDLHKRYGPIIRVNPYEVHIDDPEFYDQVYVGSSVRPTDKWWWSANMFSIPTSSISSVPHALHRRRRNMFGNHFSAATVHGLQHLLISNIDKLLERLAEAESSGQPVSLTYAYSAVTMDIITTYSFGESMQCLDRADFAKRFHDPFSRLSILSHTSKQFPWLVPLLQSLPTPECLSRILFPDQSTLFELQKAWLEQVTSFTENHRQKNEKKMTTHVTSKYEQSASEGKQLPTGTIFESMLEADVPPSEKSIERLTGEAQLIVIAGTVTTSHTLMTISYHLLTNPQYRKRLRDELAACEAESVSKTSSENGSGTRVSTAVGTHARLSLKQLEALPFLNAVIREGLRISYGVPHRLQRVFPTTSLTYTAPQTSGSPKTQSDTATSFLLPSGTPISMSALLMHENEDIFPDPMSFNPDRWLPLNTNGRYLNKYLVSFSKGSRQCVGMNLAWAEIYFLVAAIFGPDGPGHKMQLWNTDFERDVKTTMDGVTPLVQEGSQGLRVLIGEHNTMTT